MDWNAAFPAIIALVGVLIGLFGSWVREIITKNKELQLKTMEYQRDFKDKYLITPIITFVDDVLQVMDRTYWTKHEGFQVDIKKDAENIRAKDELIKARIVSYNDDKLTEAFNEFTSCFYSFRNIIEATDNLDYPYNNLYQAKIQAGVIFTRINPAIKRENIIEKATIFFKTRLFDRDK